MGIKFPWEVAFARSKGMKEKSLIWLALALLGGRPVSANANRAARSWEALFKAQRMKNPLPRLQMLDGFNEGWIEFEGGEARSRKGRVDLESALHALMQQSSAH